jgi:putative DNA primase/helicase
LKKDNQETQVDAQKAISVHATELAGLLSKRFVIASETKKGMILKTSLVKAMTGDQRMTARFMRQDYFEFQPTHKIILVTQNLPNIDESSDAIWDRVHKMGWNVRIPDGKQNTHLLEDLKEEWTGILRWAIEGCLKWQKDGILIRGTKGLQVEDEKSLCFRGKGRGSIWLQVPKLTTFSKLYS